jgi:hypothetical protein
MLYAFEIASTTADVGKVTVSGHLCVFDNSCAQLRPPPARRFR